MLARYGCRTMLRDEAAKDPRKISFFREEWPFQDERILINHHIHSHCQWPRQAWHTNVSYYRRMHSNRVISPECATLPEDVSFLRDSAACVHHSLPEILKIIKDPRRLYAFVPTGVCTLQNHAEKTPAAFPQQFIVCGAAFLSRDFSGTSQSSEQGNRSGAVFPRFSFPTS